MACVHRQAKNFEESAALRPGLKLPRDRYWRQLDDEDERRLRDGITMATANGSRSNFGIDRGRLTPFRKHQASLLFIVRHATNANRFILLTSRVLDFKATTPRGTGGLVRFKFAFALRRL